MDKYTVYIKVGENNNITEINSSAFLSDTTGYIEIDEGIGDKYHHAQNYYLEKFLIDDYGRYNYQYVDGEIAEVAEDNKPLIPPSEPTQAERLEVLEAAMLEVILGG